MTHSTMAAMDRPVDPATLSALENAFVAPAFDPAIQGGDGVVDDQADWPIVAAVAAVLGIAVAVVAYICSVCQARSFDACIAAVRKYFGKGC